MQKKAKKKGRDAKSKGVTVVPPQTRQLQTRASESRKINPSRGEGLAVRGIRQRKKRS